MKKLIPYLKLSFLSLLWLPAGCAQNPTDIHVSDPDFDERLSRVLDFSVPVISVDSLRNMEYKYLLLDTRKREEFETSHIPDALFVDYSNPDFSKVREMPCDHPIVVYCSVGYRSEKIGRKLQKMGFTQVYNLYGSIFEWVNQEYPVINMQGNTTDSVHTYNKKWAKYIRNSRITKVW